MAILTNASPEVTATNAVTLTNKTLTSPVLTDPTINGTTTNINTTNLVVEDKNIVINDVVSPSDANADGGGISLSGGTTKTLNWVNATSAWTSSEDFNLLTGKVFEINGTTVLSSTEVLGKAVPSGTIIGTTDTQTLTNKTIAIGSNTVSGTIAQFNTAVTDADFATVAGNETLTNKTIDASILTGTIPVNGNIVLTNQVGSAVPLTVKGAASQTASIQEWRKSDNSLGSARINANGELAISANGFLTNDGGGPHIQFTGDLDVILRAPNQSLTVTGAASQTVNLQEWRNLSRTVLASVASDGALVVPSVNGSIIPTSKTLVVTTDKLNVLAATTSAELAGMITDEVGTGALVFASAAINPTIVDAKGDLIAATAADAVSRIAIGANDTVLTADSTAATGMKWAAAGGAAGPLFAGNLTTVSTATLTQTIPTGIYNAFASAPVTVTVGANVTTLVADTTKSINITTAGTSMVVAAPTGGVDWTQRTLPVSTGWIAVTFGNSTFVAVAYGSSIAATSANGITWTQRTLPTTTNWIAVTFGNSTFVAVAYGSSIAATSTDGITWTQRTLPTSTNWIAVTFGNSTFVAVARSSSIAATSTDGITWTQRTLPTSTGWYSVTFGGSTFVAIAEGSSIAATSADGITWTQRTLPVSANWFQVTFGGSTFVAVATGSSIAATSTDGITWTQRTLPTTTNWEAVTFGGSTFVAVARSSSIAATSTDGITWTQRTLPTSTNWRAVTFGNSTFVSVSEVTSIAATSPAPSLPIAFSITAPAATNY
jgi:hypothetical protein